LFFDFLLHTNIFFFNSEVLRDCSLDTIEVQKDDIIILSSDGLWDVIKGNQLQEIMKRNTTEVNLIFSPRKFQLLFCKFLGFTRFS
jgi:serine/threonine protein phosphatase PrpC